MSDEVVYGVATGEYSGYSVLCICPTKEDAETVAAKLRDAEDGWYSDARVEEFHVVTAGVEKETLYYHTTTLWDDGRESHTNTWERSDWAFTNYDQHAPVVWRWVRAPVHKNLGGRLDVHGTNRELVAKVYSEKRAVLRADPVLARKDEWKGRA